MVNAEDLVFAERLMDKLIQLLRRCAIGTERFFNDDPVQILCIAACPTVGELPNDRFEKFRRGRQVEEVIAMFPVSVLEVRFQAQIIFGVIKVALEIMHPLNEFLPFFGLELVWHMLLNAFLQQLAEMVIIPFAARKTDDLQMVRQASL